LLIDAHHLDVGIRFTDVHGDRGMRLVAQPNEAAEHRLQHAFKTGKIGSGYGREESSDLAPNVSA
jgi:hypothetical protein